MDIRVVPTALEGVVVIETDFARDERGFFIETYHRQRYAAHGIGDEFVQDNHSRSGRGVLRGIHYQDMTAPMAKLVRCTAGCVFDVVVDLRAGSPTFAQWVGTQMSGETMEQVYIPVGFGHAFLTLSEAAEVQYKTTGFYAPAAQACIAWDDPDIAVRWPLDGDPIVSPRDAAGMRLRDYLKRPAFRYPIRP